LIDDSSPKAIERAKNKARKAEALLRKDYFDTKATEADADQRREIIFEDWSTKFLEVAALDYKGKPKTLKFYTERVNALLRYKQLKTALLSKIDTELVDDYRLWRSRTTKVYGIRKPKGKAAETADSFQPIAVATLNRDLATLRLMLNKARVRKYKVSDVKIKLNLKGEKRRDRLISKAEEAAYLAAAPELLRDFATIALNTGMRPDSEICVMRWENVRFELGDIYVPFGKTANAERTIPLTEAAISVLARRHRSAGEPTSGYVFPGDDDEPLSYSVIDTQHDRVMKTLDWEKRARIYDMRHTALTRMYYSGIGIKDLMRIAGHSNIKMTERYIKGNEGHVRDAFARFGQYSEPEEKKASKSA